MTFITENQNSQDFSYLLLVDGTDGSLAVASKQIREEMVNVFYEQEFEQPAPYQLIVT